MLTFFILSLLASMMIFISVSFALGTTRIYEDCKERINAADIMVMLNDDEALVAKAEEAIKGNVYLKDCERQAFLYAYGAKYKERNQGDWIEHPIVFFDYEDDCKVQTCSADVGELSDNEIILPASMATSVKLGDSFVIKIVDYEYSFKVAGFNDDNMFCSPMNMGMYKCYVSGKTYEKMAFENPDKISKMMFVNCKLTDTARKKNMDTNLIADDISDILVNWIQENMQGSEVITMNILPADIMGTASFIMPLMFVGLLMLFACIILVIAMVIINFSVKNFILTNMKNTAIMEATGYTVNELVMILLCQLVLISGGGSIVGVALGAALIDKFGILIHVSLGLPWNQPIYVECLLGVVIGVCLVFAILTLILGREYSKTSVLDALRGGVNTHNFKKNLFAFDKTSMPISVTMALKETFGKFRSQIGIIFIMLILTISTMVALGLRENYGTDEGCLKLSGIDEYDAYCEGDDTTYDKVSAMDTVDHCYKENFFSCKIVGKDSTQSPNIRVVSDTSMIKGGCVIEGRWPAYPNEIILGSALASRLGVKTGDIVTAKTDRVEENYIVSGLYQSFNNMGMTAMMTFDGVSKISTIVTSGTYTIDIFLKPGVTFEDYEAEFKEIFPEEETFDYKVAVHNTTGIITVVMKVFAFLISLITCLIVAFVEALIVRTNINRQWRNLGVCKALGFSSKELIRQVMLSNMPAIAIAVIIGLSVGQVTGAKLMQTGLLVFGFKKVDFILGPMAYILTAIMIIGVALATGAVMGRRIKTLEPVKMIMEE